MTHNSSAQTRRHAYAAQGINSVKFGSKSCTASISWSATQIKLKAPTKAEEGAVTVAVTTTDGVSNTMSFTVKRQGRVGGGRGSSAGCRWAGWHENDPRAESACCLGRG